MQLKYFKCLKIQLFLKSVFTVLQIIVFDERKIMQENIKCRYFNFPQH